MRGPKFESEGGGSLFWDELILFHNLGELANSKYCIMLHFPVILALSCFVLAGYGNSCLSFRELKKLIHNPKVLVGVGEKGGAVR